MIQSQPIYVNLLSGLSVISVMRSHCIITVSCSYHVAVTNNSRRDV